VIVEFSKALEVQVGVLLREALRDVPPDDRRVNVDGTTVDLATCCPGLSLGQLGRAVTSCRSALVNRVSDGVWLTGSLPAILDALAEVRNPHAHEEKLGRDEAARWRRQLMGIGCYGDLVKLAQVQAVQARVMARA